MNGLVHLFKTDLRLFISISVCIFLFILFFQPFPLDRFDLNNNLLFVSGFGGITFLLLYLMRLILNLSDPSREFHHTGIMYFISGLAIWVAGSVAYVFYLSYVGQVVLTFYYVFRSVLICAAPPIVLRLHDRLTLLGIQNTELTTNLEQHTKRLSELEGNSNLQPIELISDGSTQNLVLSVSDLVLVQAADNYVNVFYYESGIIKKILLRNTLIRIEQQLKNFKSIVRCHRSSIVNTKHIGRLYRKLGNYMLSIENIQESIPVSRQYIQAVKDAIAA